MTRKRAVPPPEQEQRYPIRSRDTTPQWAMVFGKRTWVQEIYTEDWGPKLGVTKCYITAPEDDDPVANAQNLNRELARMGYQLAGHGSTLPPGMTRRPGPPPEEADT